MNGFVCPSPIRRPRCFVLLAVPTHRTGPTAGEHVSLTRRLLQPGAVSVTVCRRARECQCTTEASIELIFLSSFSSKPAPESEIPKEEKDKYQEEFQNFQQELDKKKEEFQKEHPDVQGEPGECPQQKSPVISSNQGTCRKKRT